MSEIINLNRARKARAAEEAKRVAAQNRVRFGRTRAERQASALDKARADRDLDGVKRDDP